MIKDLYNGEEIATWTDTYDNGDRFVELIIYANGVSVTIPAKSFHTVAEEILKASKMLTLIEEARKGRAS
jgi:hypothetical protein